MAKSAEALRTMGEVETMLDVRDHVIRYWEKKFPQINPVKIKGRRYFRPEDVYFISGIKHLIDHERRTLKSVSTLLANEGVGHVRELGAHALAEIRSGADAATESAQDHDGAPAETAVIEHTHMSRDDDGGGRVIEVCGVSLRLPQTLEGRLTPEGRQQLAALVERLDSLQMRMRGEIA